MITLQILGESLEALSLLPSVFASGKKSRAEISTPDKAYPGRGDCSAKPSWSSYDDFINQEHREIFDQVKDISGFQMFADTYKLYEMAYFSGDSILEVGVYSGKSAIVEIRGALANERRERPPQYFGIDMDIKAIRRTYAALKDENLHKHALLFCGDLAAFSRQVSISPTMVFLDAGHVYEVVKRDLKVLSAILAPGVPVFCHDYLNPENDTGEYGIRRAVTEWEEEGYVRFLNCFGCGALMISTEKCGRRHGRYLPRSHFLQRRSEFLRRYCSYRTYRFIPGREFCEFSKYEKLAYIAKKAFRLKNVEIEETEEHTLTVEVHSPGPTVYDIFPTIDQSRNADICVDMTEYAFWETFEKCKAYSLLSIERFYDIFKAVEHIARNKIPGDFVECGVFLGGAVIAMALFAEHFEIVGKEFYLYDTFAGFPPGAKDVDCMGNKIKMKTHDNFRDTVENNIIRLGLDREKFIFVEGPVELTLKETTPESICLLRLDTDYYESTLIELQVLYPLLVTHGALLLDDYSYFEGVRRATDQYFEEAGYDIMLSRVDMNARSGIKLGPAPGSPSAENSRASTRTI